MGNQPILNHKIRARASNKIHQDSIFLNLHQYFKLLDLSPHLFLSQNTSVKPLSCSYCCPPDLIWEFFVIHQFGIRTCSNIPYSSFNHTQCHVIRSSWFSSSPKLKFYCPLSIFNFIIIIRLHALLYNY